MLSCKSRMWPPYPHQDTSHWWSGVGVLLAITSWWKGFVYSRGVPLRSPSWLAVVLASLRSLRVSCWRVSCVRSPSWLAVVLHAIASCSDGGPLIGYFAHLPHRLYADRPHIRTQMQHCLGAYPCISSSELVAHCPYIGFRIQDEGSASR